MNCHCLLQLLLPHKLLHEMAQEIPPLNSPTTVDDFSGFWKHPPTTGVWLILWFHGVASGLWRLAWQTTPEDNEWDQDKRHGGSLQQEQADISSASSHFFRYVYRLRWRNNRAEAIEKSRAIYTDLLNLERNEIQIVSFTETMTQTSITTKPSNPCKHMLLEGEWV